VTLLQHSYTFCYSTASVLYSIALQHCYCTVALLYRTASLLSASTATVYLLVLFCFSSTLQRDRTVSLLHCCYNTLRTVYCVLYACCRTTPLSVSLRCTTVKLFNCSPSFQLCPTRHDTDFRFVPHHHSTNFTNDEIFSIDYIDSRFSSDRKFLS
jgi:hypothetical protein